MHTINVKDLKIEFRREEAINNLSADELRTLYWASHPRYLFFKGAPRSSRLLDIGSFPGGLAAWKEWGTPNRTDLSLTGVDQLEGGNYDQYEEFHNCNIENGGLPFELNRFQAALCSHVLEHIGDEKTFLKEVLGVLGPGGQGYFELPTPGTLKLPSFNDLKKVGVTTETFNFFDDSTHLRTFEQSALQKLMIESGFRVVDGGIIQNKFLEDDLLSYGIMHHDIELTTYGLWLKVGWAQYVIVEKPLASN